MYIYTYISKFTNNVIVRLYLILEVEMARARKPF